MSTANKGEASRIAFVSTMDGFPWGGSEVLWSEAAQRALGLGRVVGALTRRWEPTPEPIEQLVRAGLIHWSVASPPPKGLASRVVQKVARRLFPQGPTPLGEAWQALGAWRPDVVCINQGASYDGAQLTELRQFLQQFGPRYVVICHHNSEHTLLTSEAARAAVASFYRGAAWVAFVAEGNRRKAEREIGAKIENALVIKNPVNLVERTMVPWQRRDAVHLACVARFDVGCKGQDLLIEALAEPAWRNVAWRLRLYGSGTDLSYLQRLSAMFGLQERIDFMGHVGDVRGIWADNDLLVLPSRSEGTPLTMVEAMLCGRPSVVTDVGGNAEWITEPATGFVAEAPTARSFGAALQRAWAARAQWGEIGARAHAEASVRVEPDAGGKLLELIEQAMTTSSSQRRA